MELSGTDLCGEIGKCGTAFLWLTSCIQDVRDDVAGAMRTGMKGILVKTGKYVFSVFLD